MTLATSRAAGNTGHLADHNTLHDFYNTRSLVNVKDVTYGATGDGVTDDTTAIQAAAAAAKAASAPLYFPAGTYVVSSDTVDSAIITMTSTLLSILGDGSGITTIKNTGSSRLLDIGVYEGVGGVTGIPNTPLLVRGVRLRGQTGTDVGIRGRNYSKVRLDDVWVTHHGSHGLDLRNCNSWTFVGSRVSLNEGAGIFANYQTSRDAGDTGTAEGSSANHQQDHVGSVIEDNAVGGIYMADASGFNFSGVVQRNTGDGMSLRNMSAFDVRGYFEENTGHNLGCGVGQTTGSKCGRITMFSQRITTGGAQGVYFYRCNAIDLVINSSGFTNGSTHYSVYLDTVFTGTIVGTHNGAGTYVRRYDGTNIAATNDRLIFGQGQQFHFGNYGDHNSTNPAIGMTDASSRTVSLKAIEYTNPIQAYGLAVTDGITAPDATVGYAILYVDTADGDLKVKFGDGTVATIATDT